MYRVLLDRAHSDLDSIFHSLDSYMEGDLTASAAPPLPEGSSYRRAASSNSPSQSSTSSPDLRQILQNIKSCRWRHFKPRTLKSQSDTRGNTAHCGLRGFSRSLTTALGSGTPNRGAASINSSVGEFVCEFCVTPVSYFPLAIIFISKFPGSPQLVVQKLYICKVNLTFLCVWE